MEGFESLLGTLEMLEKENQSDAGHQVNDHYRGYLEGKAEGYRFAAKWLRNEIGEYKAHKSDQKGR